MTHYQIELRPETAKNLEKFSAVISYKLGKERTPEDIIKAALVIFMKQFFSDHEHMEKELSNVIPLASTSYPLKNRFGELLNQLPRTESVISARLGISKGTLSKIVNNKNQPSMEVFIRLWFMLGQPPMETMFYRDIPEKYDV